uniref:Uncharacterized protein n=1 Tax=Fagus sylvatica TaxID=28930 RepID=A0A2N9EGV1_FAGSY
MKMIKEMQLTCQALRLASHGYEPEKPTTEDVEQCKIEDKKTIGELQNQINSASHNLSKQQYSNQIEEIFARLKSLPPPRSPDHNPLKQGSDPLYVKRLEKIGCMSFKIFWIMPLRTRADLEGGGLIRARIVEVW